MEDILSIYTNVYDPLRPLVCMDETSKQLVKETRCRLAARPGCIEKYDYEYERNGVCNIFMFYEPLGGKRYVKITDQRTKSDWSWQIKELLDLHYPNAEKVVLVMDNLNTHSGGSLYEAFAPEEARRLLERLEFHYTPKHGSWLNIAEIELRVLSGQCLNRRIPDKQSLIDQTSAWAIQRNCKNAKVDWRFTTADARTKLTRLYPTLLT